jgi:hypothetical protein
METRHVFGNAPELARLFKTTSKNLETFGCFSSPEALTTALEQHGKANFWYDRHENNDSFLGTKTWKQAIDLCRNGWREGAETVAKLRDKINAANPTGPRIVRYDVAGAYPVVARAVAGNPLNMKRIDTARVRRRPVLSLVSDMCASANVYAAYITRRAAAVAAIVDAAEAAGFQCEIVAAFRTDAHNLACHGLVTVKEAGQPVDLPRMAYGLGHAAMFRRQGFGLMTMDRKNKPLGTGLGIPHAIEQRDIFADAGTYVIPGFGQGYTPQVAHFASDDATATKGIAWLIEGLRAQNCPAFPRDREAA